jgi:magnesium-transporting ATPase (P-type)
MSLYGKSTHDSALSTSVDSMEAKTNKFSLESFFKIWFLYMFVVIILDTISYLGFLFFDYQGPLQIEKIGFNLSTKESIFAQISVVLVCAALWCWLMYWSRDNHNKLLLLIFLISIIILMIGESQPFDLESIYDKGSTHWVQLALQAPSHPFEWIFDLSLFFSKGYAGIYGHFEDYKTLHSSWVFFQYLQGLISAGVTILALVARKPTNKSVRP